MIRLGRVSWFALGIIALLVVAALALSAISGILVPLVVAVILANVLEPLVDRLKRIGVPAALSGMIGVLVAVAVGAVGAGAAAIVVVGFIQQWSEIYRQILLGWNSVVSWAADLDVDPSWLTHARVAFESHAGQLGQGVLGAVTSTFYGAISAILGVFFALFFLFFALRDADRFPHFLARLTHFDATESTK